MIRVTVEVPAAADSPGTMTVTAPSIREALAVAAGERGSARLVFPLDAGTFFVGNPAEHLRPGPGPGPGQGPGQREKDPSGLVGAAAL